jgi:hypothetical protein
MAKKDELEHMLTTPIKQGKPLKLSTSAKTQQRIIAQSHERVNRGYKLREDLIDGCKRLALDQHRKLYEVMEEALSEYLEKHKGKQE